MEMSVGSRLQAVIACKELKVLKIILIFIIMFVFPITFLASENEGLYIKMTNAKAVNGIFL